MSVSSSSKSALVIVGAIALIPMLFAGLALSAIINGWVLSILWGWFITPVFGIPAISVGQAIGLAMVVSYLTYQHIEQDSDKDKTERFAGIFAVLLIRPLMSLLLGYIVHLFI
jgi:phosphate/sulfate permease